MGQIKFTVPDEVEEQFRRQAMEAFGHRRGSIGKAGERALREWAERMSDLDDHGVVPGNPVDIIDGMLADVDADSVALQESVGRRKHERYRRERDER